MAARNRTRPRDPAPASPGMVSIRVLTGERIQDVHRAVLAFLTEGGRDVADLGLRDAWLLESAVSSQFMGSVGEVASADPREKTAMLVASLLEERPFHDACAATALLVMLVHLDENGYTPNKVSFDDFFRILWALAEGRAEELPARKAQEGDTPALRLYRWLTENTRRTEGGAWPLSLPQLRRGLEARGFSLEEAGEVTSRTLEVSRLEEEQEKRLFGLAGHRTVARLTPVHRFAAPDEGQLVPARVVRDLSRSCGLEEADLADPAARLDSLLRQHATLVQRLARL